MQLNDIVDLTLYPIDDLDGSGSGLLVECQRQLRDHALCVLPNFVLPSALQTMLQEVLPLRDKAYAISSQRPMYSWLDSDAYAPDHVVNLRTPHRLDSIIRDDLPMHGVLNRLYECDRLTEFCRRCLSFDSLHRVECPHLSLNVKVMGEGAQHAWHFDSNDGAVSLLLQAATDGGHYEYAPFIRSEDDENYSAVRALVEGERSLVQQVEISPGSFCLFLGARSLHRVSPIKAGSSDRLIALFAYSEKPGHRYNEHTLRTVLGCLPKGTDATAAVS